jgi:hypothetical protein
MRGIVLAEVSNGANPLVFFANQVGGLLADLNSLKYSVYDVIGTTPVSRIAETVVTLTDYPAGAKVGTGRYVPTIDTTGYNKGTHEVRWKYKVTASSPELSARAQFEVLDPAEFITGAEYVGYSTTKQMAAYGFTQAAGAMQRLINEASRRIELLTARFFEPRFIDMALSARGGPSIMPSHPIIGIESVTLQEIGVADVLSDTVIDPSIYQVFNRHLGGMFSPDDRDNPVIRLLEPLPTIDFPDYPRRLLFHRGVKNARIPGVYGYTDPDGSPMGQTPTLLAQVVGAFVAQAAVSPISTAASGGGGIIRSARTRDQAVTYASASEGGLGPLTGNRAVDDILLMFSRPIDLGAV